MIRIALGLSLTVLSTSGCTTNVAEITATESESALASATAPTPLQGSFQYTGTVKPLGRRTVDVIDVRMSGAATRLETVRATGASCELVVSSTWRCSKMNPASAVPEASLVALGVRNQGVSVQFGMVQGAPYLVTDGESFKEWDIPQVGTSSAGPFTRYAYRDLDGTVQKIVLPGATELTSLELIVQDADHLAKWDSKTVSEGRWRWHEDIGLVVLTR